MSPDQPMADLDGRAFDVLICGGGLAGLTLALDLRQTLPQLRVVVLERTERPLPVACHKIGESTQEIGSCYLERLGLRSYLRSNHIVKFAVRYFPGGGHLPLDRRLEIGPVNEPTVPSYQLDRGRFESDLREVICEAGVTLVEGATVRDLQLGPGEELHRVVARKGSERATLGARWLVDATGRAALLRRKLCLKRGAGHAASSGWFRLSGKVDVNQMVGDEAAAWRQHPTAAHRWRSTTHFMGEGYWTWVIPLAGGNTSVGIVVHKDHHGFDRVRSIERCWDFLDEHEPTLSAYLRAHLDRGEAVLDFGTINGFSQDIAKSWSEDRWGIVGAAGAFSDPLYSPGNDLIALANCLTMEAIRADVEGGDLASRCEALNRQYQTVVASSMTTFRHTGPVYGHPRAMATKIYWDNFHYWSFQGQLFMQRLYQLHGPALDRVLALGQRFGVLSGYVQDLLREWAKVAPEAPEGGFIGMPDFPSLVLDAHLALEERRTAEAAVAYIEGRLRQAEEIVTEIAVRALVELGPAAGARLVEAVGLRGWDVTFAEARAEAETLDERARAEALSLVARDLERLWPVKRHPAAAEAARLVFTA